MVSRRLPSLIFACLAVGVYAVAVAGPGAGAVAGQPPARAGALQRPAIDDCHHAGAPHAPRSPEQLTRQRDARAGAGVAPVNLPLGVLAAAGLDLPCDSGRSFTVDDSRPRFHRGFLSTRSSRGPPAARV